MLNFKKITFLTILILLLLTVLNVSTAGEIENNTAEVVTQNTVTDNSNNIISEEKKDSIKKIPTSTEIKESKQVEVNNYNELVEQVEEAKKSSEKEYVINLKPGNYNATQNITWGDATGTTRKLIINGNQITINGNNQKLIMSVLKKYTLELNNIVISGNTKSSPINNRGTLKITNSVLKDSIKSTFIYAMYSKCNIINTTFSDNINNYSNGNAGSAIYIFKSNVNITNSSFINNRAGVGGALFIDYYSNTTLTNCKFINNTANGVGGAVYTLFNANTTIIKNEFINNTANYGGAVYLGEESRNYILNSTFIGNTAKTRAGAIYINNTTGAKISNFILENNKAKYDNDIYPFSNKTNIFFYAISKRTYNEKFNISGHVATTYFPIDGTVVLTINNEKMNVDVIQGAFSKIVRLNITGTWNVTAKFMGNQYFRASNTSTKFNVTKRTTKLNMNPEDTIVNVQTELTGNLRDFNNTKLRNANIYITVNDDKYHVLTDINGVYSINYTPTKVGINNITVLYKGNKNYHPFNITRTFEVHEGVMVVDAAYRSNTTIMTQLTDNGKILKNTDVQLCINNETVTLRTNEEGVIKYTYKSPKSGDTFLNISYNNKTLVNKYYYTRKRFAAVSVLIYHSVEVNQTFNVTGVLLDDLKTKLRNANLYINVNGEQRHILTNSKGEYNEAFVVKEPGTVTVSILYKGNSNYEGSYISVDFPAI